MANAIGGEAEEVGGAAVIPAAVEYVVPDLSGLMLVDRLDADLLRKKISLQIQGRAVEVEESQPAPVLMIVLDVARQVCPEMVLKLVSGERILIFDYQVVPVMRDGGIIKNTDEIPDDNELGIRGYADKILIDLGHIWQVHKTGDYLGSIKDSVAAAGKHFVPAQAAILSGDAPVLLFLTVQQRLREVAAEIWYQASETAKAIKINSSL